MAGIIVTIQDPWQHVYEGGRGPYLPSKRTTGLPVNNPPISGPLGAIVALGLMTSWLPQPDPAAYEFIGGNAPFKPLQKAVIPPPVVVPFVPSGPLGAKAILPALSPAPLGLLSATQTSLGVEVDNPQFSQVDELDTQVILSWWATPDPLPQRPVQVAAIIPAPVVVTFVASAGQAQRPAYDAWVGPAIPLPQVAPYLPQPPPAPTFVPSQNLHLAELGAWVAPPAQQPPTSPPLSQPLIYNPGNTHLTQFGVGSWNGSLVCTPIQLSIPMTLQSLSVNIPGTATGNIWLGLYTSTVSPGVPALGQPNSLVAQTAITPAINFWQALPTTTSPLVAPGNYWIAILVDNNTISFDANPPGQIWTFNGGYSYNSPPNPVPTNSSATSNEAVANYATFTTAAQPVFVPQSNNVTLSSIAQAWVAPDPLPTLPKLLSPAISAVRVDQPPTSMAALCDLHSALVSWIPPDPAPIIGQKLNPSLEAIRVDRPPPWMASLCDLHSELVWWIPPDPSPVLGQKLNPFYEAVAVSQPPSYSPAGLYDVLVAWLPPDPSPIIGPKYPPLGVVVSQPPTSSPAGLYDVLLSWIPPDPQAPLGPHLNPAIEAVRVDAPPPSALDTFYGILNAWIPPDPASLTNAKIPQGIAVSVPPPYSHVATDAILTAWIPPAPQPIVNQQLNPSFEAVAVSNPPIAGSARATQSIIYASWAPGDPAIQPQRVTPPAAAPFIPGPPQHIVELAAWTPADPAIQLPRFTPQAAAFVPASAQHLVEISSWQVGVQLPTLPSNLNPSFEAVRVDSPPFGVPPISLGIIYAAWTPPPAQAPVGQQLNPFYANIPITVPPPYSHAIIDEIIAAWTPPPPQPPVNSNLNPFFEAVRVDSPPVDAHRIDVELVSWLPPDPKPFVPIYQVQPFVAFNAGGPNAALSKVLVSWIPPDPAAIVAHNANPSQLAVRVDNPPFGIPPKWLDGVVAAWIPPPPQPPVAPNLNAAYENVPITTPPQFSHATLDDIVLPSWTPPPAQAPVALKVNAAFEAVRVDNPPVTSHKIDVELVSWLPPDPRPYFPTYLVQPFLQFQPVRQGQVDTVAISWRPPDPAPIVARNNYPGLLAVKVDFPPPSSQASFDDILVSWIPPPPAFIVNGLLNPSASAVVVNNPPPRVAQPTAILNSWVALDVAPQTLRLTPQVAAPVLSGGTGSLYTVLATWQPSDDAVRSRPSRIAPLVSVPFVPFEQGWLGGVLATWQPDIQPLQRRAPAAITGVRADTPPFGMPPAWMSGVLAAWIPPPPAPVVAPRDKISLDAVLIALRADALYYPAVRALFYPAVWGLDYPNIWPLYYPHGGALQYPSVYPLYYPLRI